MESEARKTSKRAWNASNRKYFAEYYAKNKSELEAYKQAWNAANKEKMRAYFKARYEAKKPEILAKMKEYKRCRMSPEVRENCKISQRISAAKWRANNPEKVRAANVKGWATRKTTRAAERKKQKAADYEKHKAKRLATHKAYRKANPEKRLQSDRKFRAANRELMLIRQAKYRAENPEICRAAQRRWGKKNPKKKLAYSAARRARARGQPCLCCTRAAIKSVYVECPPGHEIDHITPLALGGRHCVRNLQALDKAAHRKKTSEDIRNITEYKRTLKALQKAA